MNKAKNIEQEIELTLKSFEGAGRATANPYLYQKVTARLNEPEYVQYSQSNTPKQSDYSLGLNMKYAFVILAFIILNIVTIFQFSGKNSTGNISPKNNESSEQKFAKEYIFGGGDNSEGYSNNTYGY